MTGRGGYAVLQTRREGSEWQLAQGGGLHSSHTKDPLREGLPWQANTESPHARGGLSSESPCGMTSEKVPWVRVGRPWVLVFPLGGTPGCTVDCWAIWGVQKLHGAA